MLGGAAEVGGVGGADGRARAPDGAGGADAAPRGAAKTGSADAPRAPAAATLVDSKVGKNLKKFLSKHAEGETLAVAGSGLSMDAKNDKPRRDATA